MLGDSGLRSYHYRLLAALEEWGQVVSITRTGSEQLRSLDELIDEVQERGLAPLSPNERRQLTKLLRKLADSD